MDWACPGDNLSWSLWTTVGSYPRHIWCLSSETPRQLWTVSLSLLDFPFEGCYCVLEEFLVINWANNFNPRLHIRDRRCRTDCLSQPRLGRHSPVNFPADIYHQRLLLSPRLSPPLSQTAPLQLRADLWAWWCLRSFETKCPLILYLLRPKGVSESQFYETLRPREDLSAFLSTGGEPTGQLLDIYLPLGPSEPATLLSHFCLRMLCKHSGCLVRTR